MTKLKGFRHVLTNEAIRKYLEVPPEQRLEWLEEANRFLLEATPPENRAIWERFRRGET